MTITHKNLKKIKISVLAGGLSDEREVSLRSGQNVYNSLKKLGYNVTLLDPKTTAITKENTELAFIALHGAFGEDGCIQSYLNDLMIPYTGSDCIPSLLAMNKLSCKHIMKQHEIPTASFYPAIHPSIDPPFVVKPIAAGSSIGVSFILSEEEYTKWKNETQNIESYFIEPLISGQQITVGVIEIDKKETALPILELVPKNNFYDYDAKYTEGQTEFIIPARLSENLQKQAQDYAVKLHKALNCEGFSRTDMIVSETGKLIVLELNTIPGLTDLSDLPAQAKAIGLSFDELIEHILKSAI